MVKDNISYYKPARKRKPSLSPVDPKNLERTDQPLLTKHRKIPEELILRPKEDNYDLWAMFFAMIMAAVIVGLVYAIMFIN